MVDRDIFPMDMCDKELIMHRFEEGMRENNDVYSMDKPSMPQQGTMDWHEWRNNHIGSSDAPVIMGVSPWKTKHQLWKEKVENLMPGESTPAMRRGIFLEDAARQAHFKMTGVFTQPKCIECPGFPFIAASLDGISTLGDVIVEIKCPGAADHSMAVSGKVPEKYIPQIQHQLMVTNALECHYFSFDGSRGALVVVKPDEAFMDDLLRQERDFWKQVQTLNPPALSESDYVDMLDSEWAALANEFIMADSEEKAAASKKKSLRDKIVSKAKGQNCRGAGLRVRYQKKEGSLDVERLSEVVDIDDYRKPASFFPVVGIDLKSG